MKRPRLGLPSLVVVLILAFASASSAQTNLLADPGLETSEPSTIENPSWLLDANQPDTMGYAAIFQNAPWASNPNGIAGTGLWLRAFEAEGEDLAHAVLTQKVPGTPGLTYELGVWFKVETNYISASTLLAIDFLDAGGEVLLTEALELNGQHPADGSWVRFKVTAQAPEGTAEIQARAEMIDGMRSPANPQSAMFDDFTLMTVVPPAVAVVTGFEGNERTYFEIYVDDTGGSIVDPSSATLLIEGAPANLTSTKLGKETTFRHEPLTPWAMDARLPWTFQVLDTNGEVITSEGMIRIPGSVIYGGGLVTTRQAMGTEAVTDPETARAALADADAETITVETAFVHFDDGGAPPVYAETSRPYPLFDPELGGDPTLANSDNYAILSDGEFYLREGGIIPFAINSDDGFELRVDGELIGEAGNRGRGLSSIVTADLAVGLHEFELLHWEAAGAAGVSLLIGRLPSLEGEMPPGLNEKFYELLSGYDVHNVVTEDTDGDGMDDFKENAFFGNLNRDGTGDFDSDGLLDKDELVWRADPRVKDSDGDGLLDGPEVSQHGSDPSKIDTDGDGLDDAREVNVLKTDPAKADTDGDSFADNVELALATDPLDADSKPDAVVAIANGAWNAPATWMNAQAPQAGSRYLALGEVTPTILSAAGTFAGTSLDLRGPGMTLRLNHEGTANIPLLLTDVQVRVDQSARLGGILTIEGEVRVEVGTATLELASQLRGTGNMIFRGNDPDIATGTVTLSGAGSTYTGALTFNGVDARGATPGSLGTGSITIANGSLAFGYNFSSPAAILRLQGTGFELELEQDVAVRDIIGVGQDGSELFSLFDVAKASGPFTADELLDILGLGEGISGSGTVTLLRDAGDLDEDGLRDSWEVEHFGNTNALPGDDPDGDGLSNLAEQSTGTDPNNADTDGDTLADGHPDRSQER